MKNTNTAHARLRARYVRLCGKHALSNTKHLKASIEVLQDEVRELQESLVIALRNLQAKQADYQKSAAKIPNFAAEFDVLAKHPDLTKIQISSHVLTVYTKPIVIDHCGTRYHIGRFRIKIHSDGYVRMFNTTRQVGGLYHPHVRNDGDPCLGNIQELVPSLIASRKYAALVSLCIQYLKSYNREGPYDDIEVWPIAKQTDQKKKKKGKA